MNIIRLFPFIFFFFFVACQLGLLVEINLDGCCRVMPLVMRLSILLVGSNLIAKSNIYRLISSPKRNNTFKQI